MLLSGEALWFMAESQFMKTVLFGGYDKSDVDKRMNYLYDLCFDSKNKLREAKVIIDRLKQGAADEDAINSALADDRAKLTEMQVKNQNLVEKARAISDENTRLTQEVADLKVSLESVQKSLDEANAKLASEGGTNQGAMLNMVFQQAQSSADLIVTTSKQQAENLEADSKKLAENTITDANNKAKAIIYDAEKKAASIIKDAKDKSNAMDVASGNIKASVLGEVEKMNAAINRFKTVFDDFTNSGTKMITQSQDFLSEAINDLTSGGTPVFRTPEEADDDLVEQPVFDDIDDNYITNGSDASANKGKNDVLQQLEERAKAIGGDKSLKSDKPAKKKVSLDELTKKAEAMK